MKLRRSYNNHLMYHVLSRITRNQNFLACFTGQTGSGKSYASIGFAEYFSKMMNKRFKVENIVFTPDELMKLINSGKLSKGSVIIFDEAGVNYNNRDWQSISNRMLNYLMQTFRHRNYVVLFTMPDFTFVDAAARKLFHARFETNGIDYRYKVVYTKPLFLSVNQSFGKQFNMYLRISAGRRLGFDRVVRAGFGLPSKRLVRDYEKKKVAFTDELNKEISKSISERGTVGVDKYKFTNRQKIFNLRKFAGLSPKEISLKLGITYNVVTTELSTLKSEGILGN